MVRLCRSTKVVFSETFFLSFLSSCWLYFVFYWLVIILASCIEFRFFCELFRTLQISYLSMGRLRTKLWLGKLGLASRYMCESLEAPRVLIVR